MKKVLVVGGFGALGKSVINTFKFSSPGWKIMNIDFNKNHEADENYIIKKELDKEEVAKISNSEFLREKLDCVINVAGGWQGGSIESEDVVEFTHIMMSKNLYSSILAAHLSKKFLNENSLFILTGAASVKNAYNPGMIGYQLSKNAVHHLSDILVSTNQLPKNTKVITLLPNIIDTEMNRKAMPDADFSKWSKPEEIAKKIKGWADNKDYPNENFYKV